MVGPCRACPTIDRVFDDLVCTRSFLVSLLVALSAGGASAALHEWDRRHAGELGELWVPDGTVFDVFITFAGLVVAFRTTNALNRYTEAARYLHCLGAGWFETASTLVAFCRAADAPPSEVDMFQQVLVRLISLLNALCLESLQQGQRVDDIGKGFRFEVMGAVQLDEETQEDILNSADKIQCVFQVIHNLIVDAHKSGVLSIAPPILARSFQELGAGLLAYNEAKKLSYAPLPLAYKAITLAITICSAAFVPVMMAIYAKGSISAFAFTFGGVFLLWFMYGVAEALDNPFRKHARSLDASSMQHELNRLLTQLLVQAKRPCAKVHPEVYDRKPRDSTASENATPVMTISTLLTWQALGGLSLAQTENSGVSPCSLPKVWPLARECSRRGWRSPRPRMWRGGRAEPDADAATPPRTSVSEERREPSAPAMVPRPTGDSCSFCSYDGDAPQACGESEAQEVNLASTDDTLASPEPPDAAARARGRFLARTASGRILRGRLAEEPPPPRDLAPSPRRPEVSRELSGGKWKDTFLQPSANAVTI